MFSPFGVFQSVCLCACHCSWTCSCRVPSKETKLHWCNITVNRLWSALINPSRGYEAETLHKCSRSRLRITAERPISDYWPVAIYIYMCVCVCDLLPRPVPWSPAWAHDPYPQSSLIFHGALLCFCFVILSLSPRSMVLLLIIRLFDNQAKPWYHYIYLYIYIQKYIYID